MAKLWQFPQGHKKPAFSEKVQMGDQEKFFKNRPKTKSRLKGPKALWRKWHYPLISMHLNCKDCKRFWRKQRLQNSRIAKLWQFLQGHSKPAFSEKVQRGDQGWFIKNGPQSSPGLKGPKALLRKRHFPLISMHLKCKDWRRVWVKSGSKSARMAQLWKFSQGHPKPAFSEKVQRGDQGKFFKTNPRSSPRLKGPKAL